MTSALCGIDVGAHGGPRRPPFCLFVITGPNTNGKSVVTYRCFTHKLSTRVHTRTTTSRRRGQQHFVLSTSDANTTFISSVGSGNNATLVVADRTRRLNGTLSTRRNNGLRATLLGTFCCRHVSLDHGASNFIVVSRPQLNILVDNARSDMSSLFDVRKIGNKLFSHFTCCGCSTARAFSSIINSSRSSTYNLFSFFRLLNSEFRTGQQRLCGTGDVFIECATTRHRRLIRIFHERVTQIGGNRVGRRFSKYVHHTKTVTQQVLVALTALECVCGSVISIAKRSVIVIPASRSYRQTGSVTLALLARLRGRFLMLYPGLSGSRRVGTLLLSESRG